MNDFNGGNPQPVQGADSGYTINNVYANATANANTANGGTWTNAQPTYRAAYQPKPKTVFTKTETVYSFVTFVLAFLFLRFTVCFPTGYITTAVFWLITSVIIMFMKRSGKSFTAHTRLTAVLLYLFSTVFSITANGFIKLLDTVFLVVLCVYFAYQLGSDCENQKLSRFLPFVIVQSAISYPFAHFDRQPDAVSQAVKKGRFGKNVGLAAAGLAAAVPLTAVVGKLLMSADSGVENMLGSIVDFLLSKGMLTLVAQLVFSFPIACYLFGVLYANVHRTAETDCNDTYCEMRLKAYRRIQNMAVYAAVTPICLLYLLFFISQTNYLISAFMGNLPQGYSYAEYARRGFFELVAIVIINLAVMAVMNFAAKNCGEDKPHALKIYSIAICFFTLVIIASALSKMAMYVSVYGLTQLRVYTAWFMVLCAIVFLMIILKQIKVRFNIARGVTAAFTVMFALLCFSRPDALIAKYNTQMNRAGKLESYDESYVQTLSDDGVAVYLESCDSDKAAELAECRIADYETDFYSRLNISYLLIKHAVR
jgi:hypothetical protein